MSKFVWENLCCEVGFDESETGGRFVVKSDIDIFDLAK